MAEAGTSNEKSTFGNRNLDDPDKVFEQNAWDDVEWDEAIQHEAEAKVSHNSSDKMEPAEADKLEELADEHWNKFYQQHQNRFFKDRNWLFREFPELEESPDGRDLRVLEVGCGVGNTVFPLLAARSSGVFVYCSDFSATAVGLVKANPAYDPSRCLAFSWDVTEAAPSSVAPSSVDVVTAIFVLSAVAPEKVRAALAHVFTVLRPGGVLLLRDYARYDLAQLRFKPGRCISSNFYVRGDSTRVYFFSEEELGELLTHAGFEKVDLHLDRRLVVNRGKQLKMYRSWIQAKYRRPN